MKVYNFPQKSQEWWHIRRGIPTASQFHRIITPKQCKPSGGQNLYIEELIREQVDQMYSSEPDDGFVSDAMQDGIDREHSARTWYDFDHDAEVKQVGFCLSDCGRFGCSPDGLIGDDGVLELKCPAINTHIKYLRKGGLPSEYKCQVHGELLVTKRKWCDFVSYSPNEELESLVVRVYPDAFTEMLERELESFLGRYLAAQIRLGRKIDRPIDHVAPFA